MVLPKRVIHQESPLPDDWNVDWIDQSAILKNGEEIIAEARLTDADDFGFLRPAICFEMSGEKEDVMKAFESLISRLALDYEKTPSRNPLYIKLSAQDLELIAKASRMGFISYFGSGNRPIRMNRKRCGSRSPKICAAVFLDNPKSTQKEMDAVFVCPDKSSFFCANDLRRVGEKYQTERNPAPSGSCRVCIGSVKEKQTS
ncbi:hypothetical protein [Allobaculum sp. Allo2]|uniref:hypothetical protein n=1 Tax=Allobaculum sp. Allo2 TaxID=2853432 RepID=UPI001F619252|nr:hypothetical protein [Allobaculum sp. Allo2]UNT92709.1 hypothetical protein KWG61_11410 [Allobaculum sp. Allo2]